MMLVLTLTSAAAAESPVQYSSGVQTRGICSMNEAGL